MKFLLLLVATLAWSQAPRVGVVEVFGTRKVSPDKIRKALAVQEGQPLPSSKADAEERIETVSGVARANLEAVCCENGKAILYVGIQEKGAPHFEVRLPPNVDLKLPEEVEAAWQKFISALAVAARQGEIEEDLTRGHSLAKNADVREIQLKFVDFAARYPDLLREVLRNAGDEQQRGIAAYIIGYSEKKKQAADDLQYAMQDFDPTVRNNAMRALSAIIVLADKEPSLGIKVTSTWFVEMLDSVYFTDRNKAAQALINLTEKRDPRILDHIRERAIPSLTEMAKWKTLPHSLPAFLLLGRVLGMAEQDIQEMFEKGRHDELLKKVRDSLKKK